ncbi:phytanoyl-CoA dioxygenase family protein [Pedobacter heparinus]|uniref:phytanoyl-CoA dioxygenase family protein n=1 Tax=Pedobacter heparinus TaxID=984 RepID=UPI00292EA5BF|nr:phytanoyl-CoA dioxygenase family protein [Pedobacter heparinus]
MKTNTFSISRDQINFFNDEGYLVIEDIITKDEVEAYKHIYDQFLNGTIDVGKNRSDLGDGLGNNKTTENITQIMWPSDFVPDLLDMPYHLRTLLIAQQIYSNDMKMDFDMLINKAPYSNTPTPWHQDAAYWINLPDKRALSCWLALDYATKENGCMWYVPGSHLQPLRTHTYAGKNGGALVCKCSEDEGIYIELKPGSCILHHGGTLHYSRGNITATSRPALITNYRSADMIAFERAQNFDHGRSGNSADRTVRNDDFKK